jgi:uncharacterized protein YbjT (DUF2867 family)
MSTSPPKVIVFGAAGAIGSGASLEARRRGASVWLAMRDTNKPTPNLDSSAPGYTRIQADLSDPSSLTRAVHESSATTAFVYVVFSSRDHMASAFSALKSAGITYVVLLSSFTVRGAAHEERNTAFDHISAVHAQAEMALAASGLAYAAVRPAYFNTNLYWNKAEIKNGEAGLLYPEIKYDFIAPEDIGTVCGAILAEPAFQTPDAGMQKSKIVSLCGPQIMTQRRAHEVIAEVIGREIKVRELSEEEWKAKVSFMPPPARDALLKGMRKSHEGYDLYADGFWEDAKASLEKYKKGEAMGFAEWVEAHREEFT